jgi:hypothetical protein
VRGSQGCFAAHSSASSRSGAAACPQNSRAAFSADQDRDLREFPAGGQPRKAVDGPLSESSTCCCRGVTVISKTSTMRPLTKWGMVLGVSVDTQDLFGGRAHGGAPRDSSGGSSGASAALRGVVCVQSRFGSAARGSTR